MRTCLATLLLATPAIAQIHVQDVFGSDTVKGDKFADVVDIDGDWMVVGARAHQAAGFDSGAAYVYQRVGNQWTEVQKLFEPEISPVDRFGVSVAISGNRIVVGANGDEDADGDSSGAAYTYALIGGTWTRTGRFTDPSLNAGAEYGFSVAIDGPWMVTATQKSPTFGGSAYVYEDVGGQWILRNRHDNPATSATTDYGYSVAVSVADNTVVIGAPRYDGLGGDAGGAWLYDLQGNFQQLLQPSGASPAAAQFGYSVAIDAGMIAVGAASENTVEGSNAGAVYAFNRPAGSWTEFDRLLAPDANSSDGGDLFGRVIDLDEGRLLVSAYRAESDRGHAYLYGLDPTAWRIASIFTDYQYSNGRFGVGLALGGAQLVVSINDVDPASGPLKIYDIDGGLLGGLGQIDLSNGGAQLLTVEAGASHAGEVYLVLGSRSGTAPGLAIDGLVLPLNFDAYLLKTFNAPNAAPLSSSLGVLDAAGRGYATFSLPAGSSQSLVGIQAHHAALAIDPVGLIVGFTSNAVAIELVQ